jgi:hypothetical protein
MSRTIRESSLKPFVREVSHAFKPKHFSKHRRIHYASSNFEQLVKEANTGDSFKASKAV